MIKTTAMLLQELKGYQAPANKLTRMVRQGELFPIVRGLYETKMDTPGYLLAASIYGPSYLSFDFALSYWQLIPEAVYVFTSATFDKKKKKRFDTPFGVFLYRDVPAKAYPVGIRIVTEGEYSFLLAEPEKALCDKLYTLSPVQSQKDLLSLLFEDLRMDKEGFDLLDRTRLNTYTKLYQTTNHKLLQNLLRRKK